MYGFRPLPAPWRNDGTATCRAVRLSLGRGGDDQQ